MNMIAINKRERSLGELIIVVLVFLIMMSTFVYYFFKNDDHITQVGFNNLASNFYAQVLLMHSQWLMDGRPQHIRVTEIDQVSGKKNSRLIALNKKGWIDSNENTLACHKIWHTVMNMPLRYAKQVVSAVEIKRYKKNKVVNDRGAQGRICRFAIQSRQFFEYHTINGQIKSVK